MVHEVPSHDALGSMGGAISMLFATSRVLRTIALERLSVASRRSILPRLAYRLLAL